ncbi:hypothetical protein [Phaeobacter sp. 22II1-1F12B]|uniref:hypothetical protein n=1 Tax=Phaeobacter sp. 22II1-1F12B TaxID=1317111 RepID=UPI0011865618|nr:hypothetical protein [Phaeobacter sp. 22II1-1F12B]
MNIARKIYLSTAFGVFVGSVAYAADPEKLGGFVLGSSFEAAQQHALEREWEIVPLSEHLPGYWSVEGSNLTLGVCNGIVRFVGEKLEGDLEEFAALVFKMRLELDEPDIQILSIPSGIGTISTIDVRFDTDDGQALVQLQSIRGNRYFNVHHSIDGECN